MLCTQNLGELLDINFLIVTLYCDLSDLTEIILPGKLARVIKLRVLQTFAIFF